MDAEKAIEKLNLWSCVFDITIQRPVAHIWIVALISRASGDMLWESGDCRSLIGAIRVLDEKIKAELGY